jgi:hypothetical protein
MVSEKRWNIFGSERLPYPHMFPRPDALEQEQGFDLLLISMPGRGIFLYARKCERDLHAIQCLHAPHIS